MTAQQNALALYDLLVAYRGITLEDAQERLHLSDDEMEEALAVLREAYRRIEEQDKAVSV